MSFLLILFVSGLSARADAAGGSWAPGLGRTAFKVLTWAPERTGDIDGTCGMLLSAQIKTATGVSNAMARLRSFQLGALDADAIDDAMAKPDSRSYLSSLGPSRGSKRRLARRLAGIEQTFQGQEAEFDGRAERYGWPKQTIDAQVFTGQEEIERYLNMAAATREKIRTEILAKPELYYFLTRARAFAKNVATPLIAWGLVHWGSDAILGPGNTHWMMGLGGSLAMLVIADPIGFYSPLVGRWRNQETFEERAREFLKLDPSVQNETWIAHGRTYKTTQMLIEVARNGEGPLESAIKLQQFMGLSPLKRKLGEAKAERAWAKAPVGFFQDALKMALPGRAMVDHFLRFNKVTKKPELIVVVRTELARRGVAAEAPAEEPARPMMYLPRPTREQKTARQERTGAEGRKKSNSSKRARASR